MDEENIPEKVAINHQKPIKPIQAGHDVVELCENMIDLSRELEETRNEYQMVTGYLNDIQTLEGMTPEQKTPILENAIRIINLENERMEFLKTERNLKETQYAQLQSEEDELPGIIHRLRSNETYLDAIKRDLNYLEGEKLQWSMQKTDAKAQQKFMRKLSVILFVFYLFCFTIEKTARNKLIRDADAK